MDSKLMFFTQKLITIQELPVPKQRSFLQLTPNGGKVYRLLRFDENPCVCIKPKDMSSTVSAAYHVAWGSNSGKSMNSKYISTSLNRNDVLSMGQTNCYPNGDIISIDVVNAPVTEILHVWDANVRAHLNFEQDVSDKETIDLFKTYSTAKNEVLLVGKVPKQYCEIITPKNDWNTDPILRGF